MCVLLGGGLENLHLGLFLTIGIVITFGLHCYDFGTAFYKSGTGKTDVSFDI